ncbi:MAG: hypothetical protein IDH49_11175 [Gammaproteobacteria bacterium]|nr:hypothetical protein [Gammaproteobacteria bacterium]
MKSSHFYLPVVLIFGIVIAGCDVLGGKAIKRQPVEIKPVVVAPDANIEIAPLLAYFRMVSALAPEAFAREYIQADSSYRESARVDDRIRLAMLLGMAGPREKRDEARAQRLLDGYLNDDRAGNEPLKEYAAFLRQVVTEQKVMRERNAAAEAEQKVLKERYNALDAEYKGLKERHEALNNKLRDETARSEDLQRKLDTLKAIEESILKRNKQRSR